MGEKGKDEEKIRIATRTSNNKQQGQHKLSLRIQRVLLMQTPSPSSSHTHTLRHTRTFEALGHVSLVPETKDKVDGVGAQFLLLS